MVHTLDIDIAKYVNKRMACSAGTVEDFNLCESYFFNFFASLGNSEIEEFVIMLPAGSVIFHGSTAPIFKSKNNKKNVPPVYSVINGLDIQNYKGVSKILNEESKVKAIGTINHDEDLSDDEKQEKKNEYLENYKQNEKDGIFTGKHYMWCNTTIDTNVKVDTRIMESMTVFITNKDLFLIDYFNLSKHMLDNYNISYFKRWLTVDKKYTYPESENLAQDETTGLFTPEIQVDDLKIKLRNKYANSVGDAMLIPLLNYVLALKGFLFRLDGYCDYDFSDNTPNIYDKNSNSICENIYADGSYDPSYTCREIMIAEAPKYLSYVGSCNIDKKKKVLLEGKMVDPEISDSELMELKKNVLDSIMSNLNILITKNKNHVKLSWCFDKTEFFNNYENNHLAENFNLYQNIRILPHYRYNINPFDLYSVLYSLEKGVTVFNSFNVKHSSIDVSREFVGGAPLEKNIKTMDFYSNVSNNYVSKQLTDNKYDFIVNVPQNTSDILIESDIYKSIIDLSHNSSKVLTKDVDREQEKQEYKSAINGTITKEFHSTNNYHDLCLESIQHIYTSLKKIDEKILNLAKNTNINFNTITDVYIFYLKGSSAIDYNLREIKEYLLSSKEDTCGLENKINMLGLGNSDFDINLCINPSILKYDLENNTTYYIELKDIFINFLYDVLNDARDTFIKKIYPNDFNTIFEKINKKFYSSKYDVNLTNNINNITEEHYMQFASTMNYEIINSEKHFIPSVFSPFYVSVNDDVKLDSLNDYTLLRLGFAMKTNKYINVVAELIDISIIKSLSEAEYVWNHKDDIVIYDNYKIPMMNYFSLLIDLNNTMIDSIKLKKYEKNDKRLLRMKVIEDVMCCQPSKEYIEFNNSMLSRVKDIKNNVLSVNKYCNLDSDSKLLEIIKNVDNKLMNRKIKANIMNIYNKIVSAIKNSSNIATFRSIYVDVFYILFMYHKIAIGLSNQRDLVSYCFSNIINVILILFKNVKLILEEFSKDQSIYIDIKSFIIDLGMFKNKFSASVNKKINDSINEITNVINIDVASFGNIYELVETIICQYKKSYIDEINFKFKQMNNEFVKYLNQVFTMKSITTNMKVSASNTVDVNMSSDDYCINTNNIFEFSKIKHLLMSDHENVINVVYGANSSSKITSNLQSKNETLSGNKCVLFSIVLDTKLDDYDVKIILLRVNLSYKESNKKIIGGHTDVINQSVVKHVKTTTDKNAIKTNYVRALQSIAKNISREINSDAFKLYYSKNNVKNNMKNFAVKYITNSKDGIVNGNINIIRYLDKFIN